MCDSQGKIFAAAHPAAAAVAAAAGFGFYMYGGGGVGNSSAMGHGAVGAAGGGGCTGAEMHSSSSVIVGGTGTASCPPPPAHMGIQHLYIDSKTGELTNPGTPRRRDAASDRRRSVVRRMEGARVRLPVKPAVTDGTSFRRWRAVRRGRLGCVAAGRCHRPNPISLCYLS